MSMVVKSEFVMFAYARISAIHSVVFCGFAVKELANSIDDGNPKLSISSSFGIERGKLIKYPLIKRNAKKIPRLLHQRNRWQACTRHERLRVG
jgi:acyl-coenzyme A synthetase/AMP-(fatty) acid ligase